MGGKNISCANHNFTPKKDVNVLSCMVVTALVSQVDIFALNADAYLNTAKW